MTFHEAIKQLNQFEQRVTYAITRVKSERVFGYVKKVSGTLIEIDIPKASLGELCEIYIDQDGTLIQLLAEVVGFSQQSTLISTLSAPTGLSMNMPVQALGYRHRIRITEDIYAMVFDGMGRLLDGGNGILCCDNTTDTRTINVIGDPVPATQKPRIDEPLMSQIKVIDTMLTIGKGQRLGLFAGAGCGKTTLLASLARGCTADVIVIALIGERGRELKEFLDHELDESLKKRTILVCATSDRSSMERSRAAFTATAIAESFRDKGQDVLLLVDSLTRFARAQREIGLAAGEPPAKGGFPPSVYAMLPRLIERAGKTMVGSITAIYTLLLEGDSMADPIADEAKSLLDGHIVMSRKLAEIGHYPAIDVQQSLSRTMGNVVEENHLQLSRSVRKLLSTYQDMELLIKLGEYELGSDPETDQSIMKYPKVMSFFKQKSTVMCPLAESIQALRSLEGE